MNRSIIRLRLNVSLVMLICALAAAMACPGQSMQTQSLLPAASVDLEKRIPELMSAAQIPGLSIALIMDGRIVWYKGFGFANMATKIPVNDDTVFEAASLSKPVFAYAALKLVDRGILALDAPLSDYLPEPYISGDERIKQITLRMVLKHTSGFPNWRPNGKPLVIRFTPGEKFSYSSEGFVYLQKVVERVTGRSANEVAKELVFEPLQMNSSSYVWVKEYDSSCSTGHDYLGNPVSKGKPASANAAASLHTTALGYSQFVIAVMDGTGLSASLAKEMLRPQVKLDDSCINCLENKPPRISEALSWGLGWGLEKTGAGEWYWQWGDNGVFRCFVMASRQSRSGVALFTNGLHGLSIVDETVRLALGGVHPAVSWIRYDQYDSPQRKFAIAVLRDGAESTLRRYRGPQNGTAQVPPFPESSINSLGYQLLQAKRIDDAVRIFKWNVELYPKSWNVYDSLGEALMI